MPSLKFCNLSDGKPESLSNLASKLKLLNRIEKQKQNKFYEPVEFQNGNDVKIILQSEVNICLDCHIVRHIQYVSQKSNLFMSFGLVKGFQQRQPIFLLNGRPQIKFWQFLSIFLQYFQPNFKLFYKNFRLLQKLQKYYTQLILHCKWIQFIVQHQTANMCYFLLKRQDDYNVSYLEDDIVQYCHCAPEAYDLNWNSQEKQIDNLYRVRIMVLHVDNSVLNNK